MATTKAQRKAESLSTAGRVATNASSAAGQSKTRNNPIIEELKRQGVSITRENYLQLALGEPGVEMNPEMEEYLPPYLQRRRPKIKSAKDLY